MICSPVELKKLLQAADQIQTLMNRQQSVGIIQKGDKSKDLEVVLKRISSQFALTKSLSERLDEEYLGYGPIAKLIDDQSITEIIVNGPNSIWVERDGNFEPHNDCFFSELSYSNFIRKVCEQSKIIIDLRTPFGNGVWKGFRAHLTHPPLTDIHQKLSLRRHPDNPWTFKKLQSRGWANEKQIYFIIQQIQNKKSFLVVGPTGTGKTSVINALLACLPANDRSIVIEDTSELKLPNPLSTRLLTRIDPNKKLEPYSAADLVVQSLRMRPDRIIMGEIRGPEAKDFLMALSTGHGGSIASLHAQNERQALWRLEMLVQLGAPQWNIHSVRGLISLAIDYILVLKKVDRKRLLGSIHQISSLEGQTITLNRIEL